MPRPKQAAKANEAVEPKKKPSAIDDSDPLITQTKLVASDKKAMRGLFADWLVHVKTGWLEMRKSGSWKTPVKVLIVTLLAIGVGVGIALVVKYFA